MGLGAIGIPGLILILIVALLLFGPSKLPELGRAMGRTLKEFKQGANDLMNDDQKEDKQASKQEVISSESNGRKERHGLPD